MESGGESPNGMAQSLCDLNDCVSALKNDDRFSGLDISVVGHSWGGFAALNISALHPEISHVVVMSGFVSVEALINAYFSGIMRGYRKSIMNIETNANPEFVRYNAVDSLANTGAKVLLIYSDNDKMCSKSVHYDALRAGLAGKENIRVLLVHNKGHNPNYTENAVKLLGEYTGARMKLSRKRLLETPEQKSEFLASYDWDRIYRLLSLLNVQAVYSWLLTLASEKELTAR